MRPTGYARPSICLRCLRRIQQTRSFAHASKPAEAGYSRLTNRRLISLNGPDAPKFLQGLTTNNLHPSWTSGWYSAFLTAQGRVLWDVFIYPTSWSRQYKDWLDGSKIKPQQDSGDWSCFVEVDAAEASACVKHLKRHKLRSKVDIRLVDEGEWNIIATWDDSHPQSVSEPGTLQTVPSPTSPITLSDPRVPNFGHRILLPSSPPPTPSDPTQTLPEHDLQSYTLRRYLHGIPEGQREIIREYALPQESNIDYMNGIDFRKGCYVGQELTIRTHHTGVVRKRILPVRLYREGEPPPGNISVGRNSTTVDAVPPQGTDIKKAEGRGRSAGKFLAGVGDVGLALCRLEMMTDVRLTVEGGSYTEGDEFKLVDGDGADGLRIKAFVPAWHAGKSKIREPPRRIE